MARKVNIALTGNGAVSAALVNIVIAITPDPNTIATIGYRSSNFKNNLLHFSNINLVFGSIIATKAIDDIMISRIIKACRTRSVTTTIITVTNTIKSIGIKVDHIPK